MSDVLPFEKPGVSGFLHRPDGPDTGGLALTHGAGGNCRTPLLTRTAAAFCAAGLWVLRFDLPFRQRRPRGPPSPSGAAADRAGIAAALAALREVTSGRLSLGGHSYGGRQASLLAAGGPELAAALLLFSYPLHPPGRPERPRSEHFPRLRVPTVFVHGTRDPFAGPDELRAAAAAIPAPVRFVVVGGAGHDLKRGAFDPAPTIEALAAAALGAGEPP